MGQLVVAPPALLSLRLRLLPSVSLPSAPLPWTCVLLSSTCGLIERTDLSLLWDKHGYAGVELRSDI